MFKISSVIILIVMLVLLSFLGTAVTSCTADWESINWLDNIIGWFKNDDNKKEEEPAEYAEENPESVQEEETLILGFKQLELAPRKS